MEQISSQVTKVLSSMGERKILEQVDQIRPIVEAVNALEPEYESLTDEQLRAKTGEFRARLKSIIGNTEGLSEEYVNAIEQDALDEILPEAFAAVRESAKRNIGMRHFDVQIVAGAVMHDGDIAEMRTGEGKTFAATLPLYLNALLGRGAHLVTVNDYLARRDARWMAPVFEGLGMNVGVLQSGATTQNGKMAYIVDPEIKSDNEAQNHLRLVNRRLAYQADITYGTNSEFGFDYLRDNMAVGPNSTVQRGHNFAIVDEVDNVLIDQARTPLIMTGPSGETSEGYQQMDHIVKQLDNKKDLIINEKDRTVHLTDAGIKHVENLLKERLWDPEKPEEITVEQAIRLGHLEQALRANKLYKRNKDYLVQETDTKPGNQDTTVVNISELSKKELHEYRKIDRIVKKLDGKKHFRTRLEKDGTTTFIFTDAGIKRIQEQLGGTDWDPTKSDKYIAEQARRVIYFRSSLINNWFKDNDKTNNGKVVIIDEFTSRLMPGRRWSDGLHQAVEAKEGVAIQSETVTYASITIQNYFRMYKKLSGMTGTGLTSAEEFNDVYDLKVVPIPTNRPDLRIDEPDRIYKTEDAKTRAIITEVVARHATGQPILIGTATVENSEELSKCLDARHVDAILKTILLRDEWFKQNDQTDDGHIVPQLQSLNVPLEDLIKRSTINKVAMSLGFIPDLTNPKNIDRLMEILEIKQDYRERFVQIIKDGIPHTVLNARNHTLESQIIAGAGAHGAVTVATNMAGRGVDIKLGGELPNEVFAAVNTVLKEAGHKNIFDIPQKTQYLFLRMLGGPLYVSHSAEVKQFMEHMEAHEQIINLGGLRVIGSEKHEARRIDNQLRGRAARQGDQGSSRFYTSLDDDMMRISGGESISRVMTHLKIDPSVPIESKKINRIVDDVQMRVEGANYDVRKHLLEYDDVLNLQREKVYGQKAEVAAKPDLSDDVVELIEQEIDAHAPKDEIERGELRTLAVWLSRLNPPIITREGLVSQTFTNQILLDALNVPNDQPGQFRTAIRNLTIAAFEADPNPESYQALDQMLLDLDIALSAIDGPITDNTKLSLLNKISVVQAKEVDESGKQIGIQNIQRLDFSYYLGHQLGNIEWSEQREKISDHLVDVLEIQGRAWGEREIRKINPATLDPNDKDPIGTLGTNIINNIARETLRSSISELWVDYIRRMEGLRVAIGLEAYAQRDPLTAYKSASAEMFNKLIESIRSNSISRLFRSVPPTQLKPPPPTNPKPIPSPAKAI